MALQYTPLILTHLPLAADKRECTLNSEARGNDLRHCSCGAVKERDGVGHEQSRHKA